MKINICLASDNNYWDFMTTTIVSILANANQDDELCFYLLCNDVPKKLKSKLMTLNKIKQCEFNFIDVDQSEFDNCKLSEDCHLNITTYFRIKLPEVVPFIDKILYLDCDIIVLCSLSELFSLSLSNHSLAGVEDVGYYYWRDHCDHFVYSGGYFVNAGVLLLNLKYWRDNNTADVVINVATKKIDKPIYSDQDAINIALKGSILPLDYKWNVQDSFYRKEPEVPYNPNSKQILEAAKSPAIIHYTNVYKPWNNRKMPKAEEWRKYNIKSPFRKKFIFKVLEAIVRIPFNLYKKERHDDRRIVTLGGIIKIKYKK